LASLPKLNPQPKCSLPTTLFNKFFATEPFYIHSASAYFDDADLELLQEIGKIVAETINTE
jgi:hypothetical protein